MDKKKEIAKKMDGANERAIDRANRVAKKPKSFGYHSSKKITLNPNRKPETNIYSREYKADKK